MVPIPSDDAATVRAAVQRAHAGLVDRELLTETVALCAVAREHLLVVGPPGTAKSQAVRAVAEELGGRYFEYLLGRFTEPNEVFGPIDLRRLRDGVVEVQTAGMLPEADVVFLDEVFLGSSAILNTLLGLLNERVYRRGATAMPVPLRVCVGATNSLPADPSLAAFADRFLARVFVEPIDDALLEDLLAAGQADHRPGHDGSPDLLPALDRLAAQAARCDLAAVRPMLAAAVRRLRAGGVALSDRRAVRAQRLIAASAALDGRSHADADDLWVLPLIAPTLDAQRLAQDLLADVMSQARNSVLAHAADQLSRGRAARADRLTAAADQLLAELAGHRLGHDNRLRVEASLRDIDASFAVAELPAALAAARQRLIALLPR